MAAANIQKAQVLQDEAALNFFTLFGTDTEEVAEYLWLQRQEELTKLRGCLDDVATKARVVAAEKARIDALHAGEVAEAMRQQVPPPPLSRSPSPERPTLKRCRRLLPKPELRSPLVLNSKLHIKIGAMRRM
jgi:hypothetical protein